MLTLCDFIGRDGYRFSPYVWRTKLALARMGLDYDLIGISFTDKQPLRQWTDHATAPVLNHDGRVICDSWDIAIYLQDTFTDRPALFADEGSKRLAGFLNGWVPHSLYPAVLPMIAVDVVNHVHPGDRDHYRATRETRLGQSLEVAAADRSEQLTRFRELLEPVRSVLAQSRFLNGETAGYPDFILAGLFLWIRGSSPLQVLMPGDPVWVWRNTLFSDYAPVISGVPGYD